MADREFLFEYDFGGQTWCITIHAINDEQARRKIKAAGMARYKGEVHATIPVLPASPWTSLGWAAGAAAVALVIWLAIST